MSILRLFAEHAGSRVWRLLLTTSAGGALSALVVTIANIVAASDATRSSWYRALMFALAIGLMYVLRRAAATELVEIFEQTSASLRARLAEGFQRAPLRTIERLDARLHQAIGDLAFIATTLEAWVSGVQHTVFALAVSAGILWISGAGFLLWVVVLSFVTARLWRGLRSVRGELDTLSDNSARLGGLVDELVGGYVQAKLDPRIARGLAVDIQRASAVLYDQQNRVFDQRSRTYIEAYMTAYVLGTGFAAFGVVGLGLEESYDLIMFFELIYAPLFGLIAALPEMARSDAAADSVLELLELLSEVDDGPPCASSSETQGPAFASFGLRRAEFRYEGEGEGEGQDFVVGPIDLELRRGELVLVTGGNGSGKTTLMKMLLGLYLPQRGGLVVDGRELGARELERWRSRFTTIMSHQYLFDRLYGLEHVDDAQIAAMLAKVGLEGITEPRDGALTNLALSTGQRMRVAMAIALLEDRPVCLFDEWTACQDPTMTRWYYDTLLRELCAAGKTVIAVSHDARYFDRGDRLLRMSDGQLVDGQRARPRRADPRAPGPANMG